MSLAIIGGTGIDEMKEFVSEQAVSVSTRFGSADIIRGEYNGKSLFFVPRHGLDHSIPPSRINYRAQIAALKKLGVEHVIGICAVGSLSKDLQPGSFAILRDFIDLTKHREDTFFNIPGEPVVHTDFTCPYCPNITDALAQSCADASNSYKANAIYVGVEGPRYETPAEIKLYGSWGANVIGMTNLPEAVLAREAGLCYGVICVVTNFAAGISAAPLSHDEVRNTVASASDALIEVLHNSLERIVNNGGCTCRSNQGLVL